MFKTYAQYYFGNWMQGTRGENGHVNPMIFMRTGLTGNRQWKNSFWLTYACLGRQVPNGSKWNRTQIILLPLLSISWWTCVNTIFNFNVAIRPCIILIFSHDWPRTNYILSVSNRFKFRVSTFRDSVTAPSPLIFLIGFFNLYSFR